MPDTNIAKVPSAASQMKGSSGTTIFDGYITNEEYNSKLVGLSGLRIYDRMRNDATVRQLLQVCKLPIQSTRFYYQAAKEDPIAEDKELYINNQLFNHNIDFDQLVKDSLLMLDFGYSLFEFTLEVTQFNGEWRIGVKTIEWRKNTSITKWETEDGKPGVTQQLVSPEFKTVSIDEIKLIRFTHDQEGQNYVGRPLLRSVYKNWDIREKLEIIDAVKHERQGLGVPHITTDMDGETSDPKAVEKVEEIAQNMRANESAFVRTPKNIGFEMLDMKASSTTDIIPSMNYHDARIMKSGLAGFLEIGGQSGSGSQSLSKDLSSLFMKAEESTAKTITSALMNNLIKLLLDLNYTDNSKGYGELKFDSISDEDPTVLAASYKSFADAGLLTPDVELEEHIRKAIGAPEMTQEAKDGYDEKHKPVDTTPAADPTKTDPKLSKEDKTKQAEKDIKATIENARELVRKIDVHYVG